MNILVTGGAGFIGHNIVKQLEEIGHNPTVVDNFTTYGVIPQEELAAILQERIAKINAPIYECDIMSALCSEQVAKNDAIIHMASFPRQKVVNANPREGAKVMVEGLVTLLEAAVKHDIKRFVYISSSMVYGNFENDVSEDAECNPIGQYAIFKYMGEKLVEDYSRKYGLEYTIIRPSAVYGEQDVLDRVVSMFMMRAMNGQELKVNGPDEVLDFTYVDDTAAGIVGACLSPVAVNKIYNITRSGTKLCTLLDAANYAIEIAGKGTIKSGVQDPDFPKRGRLDITAARKDFGYDPQVDVKEGFRRYYRWFNASPIYKSK